MPLNQKDFMMSTSALKDFKEDSMGVSNHEYEILPNIVVEDETGEELFSFNNVDVTIVLSHNYHSINIMWEDVLSSYKKHNLYGTYRTDYNLMEYSYNELIIYSDDKRIIIKG
ncbi:hypothetical protein [uncultured Exiguobacterium sp.]|uniref:hypothetical protein n=1 Tax=uncultured Exiguobacterium sp. TaxID=202669 RepID=UPI0025F7C3B8|nr:hypothetical protein [uncultured Exiguobacterium sp.]